jgi:hypothetical protein
MMRLLITALALVGLLSVPTFFRSSPAAFPNDGIADCKRTMPLTTFFMGHARARRAATREPEPLARFLG